MRWLEANGVKERRRARNSGEDGSRRESLVERREKLPSPTHRDCRTRSIIQCVHHLSVNIIRQYCRSDRKYEFTPEHAISVESASKVLNFVSESQSSS